MAEWPDEKIRNIAVWDINKASMHPATWRFTLIGAVHPEVEKRVTIQEGELPLVSSFISEASWYLFTTRRILGAYASQWYEAAAADLLDGRFGNFKGYPGERTNVMTLLVSGGNEIQLEFETGRASMAPIHYLRFWRLRFPFLDNLRFDPRPQSSVCPQCGKPLRTAEAQQCFQCGADWHGDA